MTTKKNYNCDGAHCTSSHGEVRVYPLGGSANLILCHSCFTHENRYRHLRGVECKRPEDFPQVNWTTAEHYGEQSHGT